MKMLKIKLLFAVVATFLLLDQPIMHSAQASDGFPPTEGDMQGFVLLKQRIPTPDGAFFDGKGNVRHVTDFKGQVILMNFWATWCAPCIQEMPDLDRLEAELGSDDFKVVAISQDLKGAAVAGPFLRDRLKLENLNLFIDKKAQFGRSLGLKGLPATFLIDREGLVVGYFTGSAHWASDDSKKMIQYVIDE